MRGLQLLFHVIPTYEAKGSMQRIDPITPTAIKKPAKAKAETVTLRHLATALADSHGLPKKQVSTILEGMVEVIAKHLKKGKRIRISGLEHIRS
jgi:hypothetical protein